uniref:Uncharacterized protein n=1 Tax=Anguilla anguilla TaxID=7936 RepID=A0A0E9UUF8_ANGAN
MRWGTSGNMRKNRVLQIIPCENTCHSSYFLHAFCCHFSWEPYHSTSVPDLTNSLVAEWKQI